MFAGIISHWKHYHQYNSHEISALWKITPNRITLVCTALSAVPQLINSAKFPLSNILILLILYAHHIALHSYIFNETSQSMPSLDRHLQKKKKGPIIFFNEFAKTFTSKKKMDIGLVSPCIHYRFVHLSKYGTHKNKRFTRFSGKNGDHHKTTKLQYDYLERKKKQTMDEL